MEYAIEMLEEALKMQQARLKKLNERASLFVFVPECEEMIKDLESAITKLKDGR